ncbi:MAG: hypothetical protein AB7F86_07285 [Bdellovibrionales bacterium]
MSKSRTELDRLLEHLYTPDRLETIEDVRTELTDNGIDFKRVVTRVDALLKSSAKKKPLAWLDAARKKHAEVEQKFNEQRDKLKRKFASPRELVEAIRSGAFGESHQSTANAFFRNQDFKSLTDRDLISFIEDCELLGSLDGSEDSE